MSGEEFAVLMPETDSGDACEMVARLRPRLKSTPLIHENHTIQIPFPAGLIATWPQERCPEAMLKRADRLLRQARENGRDQVVQGWRRFGTSGNQIVSMALFSYTTINPRPMVSRPIKT